MRHNDDEDNDAANEDKTWPLNKKNAKRHNVRSSENRGSDILHDFAACFHFLF